MTLQGKFISIDGTDCTGKGTLITHLVPVLQEQYPDLKIHITKEPTNGPIGQQLKQIFSSQTEISDTEHIILFYLDRIEHQQEINEYIAKDYLVITDRYYHSTLAYQDQDYAIIKKLHVNSLIRQPNLTLILDAPLPVLLERLSRRNNKELFENEVKLAKAQRAYCRILNDVWSYPIRKIDTNFDLASTLNTVVEYIGRLDFK